jgi:hypothetical protein
MSYTVKMVLLDQLEDADEGFPTEPLAGTFPTVDRANGAGDAEIERRKRPPGSITYKVYDSAGKEVDEAGMGLS